MYVVKQAFKIYTNKEEQITAETNQKKLAELYENLPHLRVYLIEKIDENDNPTNSESISTENTIAPKPRKPRAKRTS